MQCCGCGSRGGGGGGGIEWMIHHQMCRNDKNEKVKAAFEVKWLQFISAKLVHLSLNFTPQR